MNIKKKERNFCYFKLYAQFRLKLMQYLTFLIHDIGHPCESLTHLNESTGATPLLGSHEALEDEIKRLRERLHTVENENVALNSKLSQQQWDLENRLADIEMQLCGASSASSVDHEDVDVEDVERNRESII